MNRLLKAILAAVFIIVIMVSAISICTHLFKSAKIDITEQDLFTLSDGTKKILGKLSQPVTVKLYYAQTAAMKAPDMIKDYNEYFYFVRALMEEYAAKSNGMMELQVIDPRPFSDDEQEALRYGIKRFQITEDESFFFGLVAKTEYGAAKTIEFFAPDRQNFVEYDVSYLLDSLVSRNKTRIGVISSLPITGQQVSQYMQMQGQRGKPAWTMVQVLEQRYEVQEIQQDVDEITGIDLLMVVHPKDFSDKALYAIDQYVVHGGRAIVFVDPHCIADMPAKPPQPMYGQPTPSQASDLNKLLRAWGVEVPQGQFAGDKILAVSAAFQQGQNAEKHLSFLELTPGCFNDKNVISAKLNRVLMFFGGAIQTVDQPGDAPNVITPLVSTTADGNTWQVSSPQELQYWPMMASQLMKRFIPGTEPVMMGCMITGKFASAFPEGLKEEKPDASDDQKAADPTKDTPETHLTKATEDCAVAVFSDVDFVSDLPFLAYRRSGFGMISMISDNNALLVNTIENLLGSGDLIAIRSRGSFSRPFTVVDDIESAAEEETAKEVDEIKAEIKKLDESKMELIRKMQSEGVSTGDITQLNKQSEEFETKKRQAQIRLNDVQKNRREKVEALGTKLKLVNILLAPALILVISIILAIRRSALRYRYLGRIEE
ncbi:MAG: Gldg family protein [Phycisphaerae bacterium]|nr:Gldg family protein [Phycisphaerae bacterium]